MEAIRIEDVSQVEKKIFLNIENTVVNKEIDDFFSNVKKTAQVKGFRKGKAPLGMLKKLFQGKARLTIAQALLVRYYAQALKDHNLNPVGQPVVGDPDDDEKGEYPGEFSEDNSFTAELTVEVLPEVDPQNYKGLPLAPPDIDIDGLYDVKMLHHREQFAERKQITDRPAQLGDSMVIGFKGFIDGDQFEGGSEEGFTINSLGQSNFVGGFEEQIVGMSAEETKNIDITFPEKYGVAHLAGKEANFDVTVHSIIESKLAEIDNDLALMVGHSTTDELTTAVREEVTAEAMNRDLARQEFQIVQELLKHNTFEVPESMITLEYARILNQISGIDKDNLADNIKEDLRKKAKMSIQKAILFEAIYEKEDGLEVGPEELNDLLEIEAEKNNQTKDELVSMLYNSNQMDSFVSVLRNKKVAEFIISESVVKIESEKDNELESTDTSDASSDRDTEGDD